MTELTITDRLDVADIESIREFEDRHGISIPADYKQFLARYNAISVRETLYRVDGNEFWISEFYPFSEDYEVSLQRMYDNLSGFFESKYMAFAGDAGGWQFVLSLKCDDYGKVYFCRMDEEVDEALTLLAHSFDDFVGGLTS